MCTFFCRKICKCAIFFVPLYAEYVCACLHSGARAQTAIINQQNNFTMDTNLGFVRVAAAVPVLRVGDCAFNAQQTKQLITEAISEGVEIVCFPELGLTGYTCADLFFTNTLQQKAMAALQDVCEFTRGKSIIVLVGAPLKAGQKLRGSK